MPSFDDKQSGKVLFVDDEENILKSIRRGFYMADFEVHTALGAKAGLAVLEKEDIDLVISDVRMPEMDGIRFLEIVKEKYPSTSRGILSGFVEQTAAFKSLTQGLTSTYFAKPWEDEVLQKRIRHILYVRKILHSQKLLLLINSIGELPTLPSLYQEFMQAMEDEKSIKEISAIIQKDTSIAAKVLQIANSAFYGSNKTSSVDQAMLYIGLSTIKDIVLAVSLTSRKKWNKAQDKFLEDIFAHSSQMNRYVVQIYKLFNSSKRIRQFPSVGLMHDIGKIILLQYYPERFESIVAHQENNPGMNFFESEMDLGYEGNTHAEIGAFFLDWWNLPAIFTEVALFHHTPEKASEHHKEIVKISHFTNRLLNYLAFVNDPEKMDLSTFQFDGLSEEKVREIAMEILENKNG